MHVEGTTRAIREDAFGALASLAIVVVYIMNQTEYRLGQNKKENCHYHHISFNMKFFSLSALESLTEKSPNLARPFRLSTPLQT